MQPATEMELLSTYCTIALTVTLSDRHEIYLSPGHFVGNSKEEKSGLFQMYVGNKSVLMVFSSLGCSTE